MVAMAAITWVARAAAAVVARFDNEALDTDAAL